MGLDDRHYVRDGRYTASFNSFQPGTWPPVCKWIIFANIIIFLAQIFLSRPATLEEIRSAMGEDYFEQAELQFEEMVSQARQRNGNETDSEADARQIESSREQFYQTLQVNFPRVSLVQSWLELDPAKVKQGQVWRLVTCAFCHSRHSIFHILFNMLFVYWFGKTLELMYGSREFLFFYLGGAIVSSLAFLILAFVTGDMVPAIGASGAVMAIVILYAIHFPRQEVRIYMLIPVEIRWVVLFYVIYDLHPVLLTLAGSGYRDGIAHSAHLGGLFFGFIYWKAGWRLSDFGKGSKRTRNPSRSNLRLRIHEEDSRTDEFDSMGNEVDEILAQINEQGIDSLNDQQRELLKRVSEQLNQRENPSSD